LLNYLKEYVKRNSIKNGTYIITNRNGKMYATNKFTDKVKNVMKKYTNIKLSMDNIRKIKTKYLLEKNNQFKNKSYKDIKEFYRVYFQHTQGINDLYYKKIEKNEEEKEDTDKKEESKKKTPKKRGRPKKEDADKKEESKKKTPKKRGRKPKKENDSYKYIYESLKLLNDMDISKEIREEMIMKLTKKLD
jgi:ABC-type Zn2+ transport system substrate-binding protein/surface adhesin